MQPGEAITLTLMTFAALYVIAGWLNDLWDVIFTESPNDAAMRQMLDYAKSAELRIPRDN